MIVIAAKGLKVPKETEPKRHITDSEAVDVAESAYYLRRLADGDLLLADSQGAQPKKGK